ncbi:uncharacterized protein EHS24_006836 [Apiotrichum porosum]|uniref:Uncharacterized protein n=1 Tax=Apiotrichum porosum TaxID=105984 RepID=A0A427XW96_9TREE|nr:uncharacterized protein EHS24_006836 [Apiotrichum porosum]RSH83176.1 hypothetical protein EHS24_006836 [Apiotrichum porosum]
MASLPSAGIMTFGGFTNPRTAATTTTSSPTSTINPLSATPTPDFAYVSYVPSKSPISVRVCEGAHDGLNRGDKCAVVYIVNLKCWRCLYCSLSSY